MAEQPLTDESRKFLGELRDLLLQQHKLLLDRERAEYEKAHGAIAGPAALLTLVLEDPHFAWLRQISMLVVEIDEALSRRNNATQPAADALTARAREMMNPDEQGGDFQVRYSNAVKEAPAIAVLHGRIAKLLEI